ncbi:substrate-binding domain-containing protein [Kitasatospora sp. NPDC048365]|uniref:substrate-binding domain-containing protein n=1 Tax=Kitasatospora sp. NPDC048365 TaxID=3364050 RepID=UPI003723C840
MSSTSDERRTRVLHAVDQLGSVRVTELAEQLRMPVITLRRDVAALAEVGLVHRVHGSVVSTSVQAGTAVLGPSVGLLVPGVGQYFDEVIAGARQAAGPTSAQLVLGISSYEASADRVQVDQLLRSGVEGLLLAPNWTADARPQDQDWVARLPVPTVLVERRPAPGGEAAGLDTVSSDHRHGVLLALRHLSALGHGRIALMARSDTWTAHEVRRGYAEGCELLGLVPGPVLESGIPVVDAAPVAEALADGVTAVLVHNDQDALQLLPLLRARGLRVPEDLAVVSYDDVFAALGAPPLTAVAPPKRAVGAEALGILLRRLGSPAATPVCHLQLLPELTVRESCGAARR